MRPQISSLLIALGLLMASGCVLPNQNFSRSDDYQFDSRSASKPLPSTSPSSNEKLTFKVPQRRPESSNSSTGSADADSWSTVDRSQIANTSGYASIADLTAGHSIDSPNSPSASSSSTASDHVQLSSNRLDTNLIAGNERVADDDGSHIQLQALEFDGDSTPKAQSSSRGPNRNAFGANSQIEDWAPAKQRTGVAASTVPNWADRPIDQQANKTANSSPATWTGGSIKQANHADPVQSAAKFRSDSTLSKLPWEADLDQLIAKAEQHLAQSKPDGSAEQQNEHLRKQAQLRLLYMMAQRQQEALTAIPGAAAAQQEFWQQMIWAMSNSFDTVQFPDSDERAAQTISPLSSALRQMREEASLSIKNMAFCRKISYFGNYERFPRNEFVPGDEVLLYTEIENFVSSPTVDGEYRTSLKSQIEINDSKGQIVWTKGFPSTEDFCRNPRRDYFHNYQFHIPEDLPTGAYSLKLTISDELSHKRISNSLNFLLK